MSHLKIYLKDHSGRDFGGDFKAVHISGRVDGFTIDLEYSGKKSSKRLDMAAIFLDRDVVRQLCQLSSPRPWPQRSTDVAKLDSNSATGRR